MSPPSTSQTAEVRTASRSSSDTPARRKRRSIQEEPLTSALNRLENISSSINNKQPEYDEFHFFGQNIAAQLRALPLFEALNVQTQIHTLLTEARRRHLHPKLSTFTYPTSNTQTVTSTPPVTNMQTMNSAMLTDISLQRPDYIESDSTPEDDMLSRAWSLS